MVGLGGHRYSNDLSNALLYFCSCFILIGLVQSIDFPCFISTVGAWTERRTRGIVTGIWATCSNTGNIIGLQLAAFILSKNGEQWEPLMFVVTFTYLCLAAVILVFFVAEPAEVGLRIDDMQQEE